MTRLLAIVALALLVGAALLPTRAAPEGAQRTNLPLVMRALPPTPTPVPPTPTATPPPGAPGDWRGRVNYYRALSALPPVGENAGWGAGGILHSRYMVKNDVIVHAEDPANPWYTAEGDAAGRNGNVAVSSSASFPDAAAIDLWIVGPFHAVGILDPKLLTSGYGAYREADGGWQTGATLDVLRGRGSVPPGVSFPVAWPRGAAQLPLRYTGGEWPDPLTSCPGYATPSGLPLLIQLGTGSISPSVTASSLTRDGQPIEHCRFDETSYTNPDGGAQSTGRAVLNSRDAVVIVPRQPLLVGSTYVASVTANGQTHTWSFTVAAGSQSADEGGTMEAR